MRTVGLLSALAVAGYHGGAAPAPATGSAAQTTCGSPFRAAQKSFKRMEARNAYVWVDDIESNARGGYSPFQLAVVVGRAYPPFRADEGRLERRAFERFVSGAYGLTRVNATVSEAAVRAGASLRFTSAGQTYILRVIAVNPIRGGEDAVMLKLCR